MVCVAFELDEIEEVPDLAPFANIQPEVEVNISRINQDFVEQNFVFTLNGECHGERVFNKDLVFIANGKKIVKSVQDRLLEVKEHLLNQVLQADSGLKKKFNSQKPED